MATIEVHASHEHIPPSAPLDHCGLVPVDRAKLRTPVAYQDDAVALGFSAVDPQHPHRRFGDAFRNHVLSTP